MLLALKILGGVLAFALGLWLGRPARYQQNVEELDELLAKPGRSTRKVKRHFTPMDVLQRKKPPPQVRPAGGRFRLSSPDERQ